MLKKSTIATAFTAALMLGSCSWVEDDLSGCPDCNGTLSVKIEHKYNMLNIDAASTRVESADVFVRNKATGVSRRKSFTRQQLDKTGYYADMAMEGGGSYDILVWSGISDAIFNAETRSVDLGTQPGDTIDTRLPVLFHGAARGVEVEEGSDNVATVDLVQDTKQLNVTVNYSGSRELHHDDFRLVLTAPNSVLDADNQTAAAHSTAYKPYSSRVESIERQQVANYSLSTLRLMEKDRDRCRLALYYQAPDGSARQQLFDIPLIDYLLMCKTFEGEGMTSQEYLDRQNFYHIVFLLQDTDNPREPFAISMLSVNNWQLRTDDATIIVK